MAAGDARLGYSIGLLIVTQGRRQLFTENTPTPIRPWLDNSQPVHVADVLRRWGVVLLGNLVGAHAVGWAGKFSSPPARAA